MAWFDEAVFYHIYPLGLTGSPKQNEYTTPVDKITADSNIVVTLENFIK